MCKYAADIRACSAAGKIYAKTNYMIELTEMPITHFSIKGSKNINIEQICCKCAAGVRACSAASKISAKTNYIMR